MSSFVLKIIALVSMTIDHIGVVFYYCDPQLFKWFRYVGRLAFPIYCFLLVEGFYHTRSRKKYLARLCVFAVISEPFFDLAFEQSWFSMADQNVFCTLAIGLAMMMVTERFHRKLWAWTAALSGAVILACLLRVDYGYKGILFIFAFYVLREHRPWDLAAAGVLDFLCFDRIKIVTRGLAVPAVRFGKFDTLYVQDAGILALPLLACYNGKRGKYSLKYFFYVWYPLHLFVLGMLLQALR